MERKFPLGRGGGALLVREEGLRAAFEAELFDDRRGLYKAYVSGAKGNLLLGTLMPENGRLRLRRTFPVSELEKKGCWPVVAAEARLAFPFDAGGQPPSAPTPPQGWASERDPGRFMGDRVLAHSAGELRGALFRREEGGFALAAPFGPERDFPLQPLFCFAHIERLQERLYAIFYFNTHGCPIFQNKEKSVGHTDGANQ